jgi:predicted HTH transcriptional regulator
MNANVRCTNLRNTNMDLSFLPTAEDDEFEFKSSATPTNDLSKKLAAAGSAFSNSGGGWFIAGVDDKTGNADGGVAPTVGRQDLRNWVDQARLTEASVIVG